MNVFILGVPHKGSSALLASPYMEKELKLLGINPTILPVNDESQLTAAIQKVVLLGGLILTPLTGNGNIDKLLSDAMAKACGCSLELNETVFQQMAEKNAKLSKEEVTRYATLPKGARVYAIHSDTYPAYQLDGENIHAVLLPADKEEQCAVFLNTVFPTFAQQPKYPCSSHILRVMELSLSEVETALKDGLAQENPCISIYPGKEEVVVRVSVRDQSHEQASAACQAAANSILNRLGSYVYGMDVPNIEWALLQRLEKKQLHLAVHEFGSNHCAEKRLIKCKKFDSVELSFPEISGASFEAVKAEQGVVSQQTAVAAATAISNHETIGVAITMPTAKEKAASAFVAASFSGHVLTKEVPISGFHSVQQLTDACVSHALNLARKFADSHPSLPKGAAAALVPVGAEGKAKRAVKEESPSMNPNPTAKKQSLPKRILSAVFPQKADSKSEKMRKLGIILCLCVFCGSMGYLLNHRQQGINAEKENEKFTNLIEQAGQGNLKLEDLGLKEEDLEKVEPEVLDKYKPFVAVNEDMIGWISIADTKINYPVVQTTDNDYYHRKNFQGEDDYYGVPYLDYECRINLDPERESDNMIIYGHNIGNDGLMFNPISYYKQLDFYKKHPVVRFDSIYREQEYKIFGVMIVNAQPEQDNGTVFNYNHEIDFLKEGEFEAYVNEVRKRSMWDIDVDVNPDDNLLTISTCCYDFRPEARCVVVARAVREGEDATVDTSTAKVNADAYYPKAYYDALNEKAKYGQVKGIKIDGKKEYTLEIGQTLQLKAITDPADAPINTCSWDSSVAAVATVDKNGLVTAVAPGETSITAMADDGGYAASVKIYVKAKNALEYLYFDEDQINLSKGDEYKLTVYAEPEDAALDLSWSCDSEAISLSVNKSNPREVYLRANANTEAPATITVQDKTTKLSASVPVTVGGGGISQTVTATAPAVTFTPAMNGETSLTVTVTPPEAAYNLKFASSDKSVVKILDYEIHGDGTITLYLAQNGEVGQSATISFKLDGTVVGSSKVTIQGETAVTPPPASGGKENITITHMNGTVINNMEFPVNGGEYFEFTLSGAKVEDCTWSFTNPDGSKSNLAYIDDFGDICTNKNNGADQKVIVTVKGPNGGTSTFTVLVKGTGTAAKETCSECKQPVDKHAETCTKNPNYKPPVETCGECDQPVNKHAITCTKHPDYKPPVETCGECGQPVDNHATTCTKNPNYVPPTTETPSETPACTCDSLDGVTHAEGCALYQATPTEIVSQETISAQSLDEELPPIEETPSDEELVTEE